MLMNDIRQAIAQDHEAIERTAFSVALATGTISRDAYLHSLKQLFLIHSALESCCAKCDALVPFFGEEMKRTQAIQRDFVALSARPEDYGVEVDSIAITAQIHAWHQASPLILLGVIYILEGSRMGSMMLAKPIASALSIQAALGQGIDYHLEAARETPARLKAWKEQVSSQISDEQLASQIQLAAVHFMKMLCTLYASLPTTHNSRCVA